MNTKKNAEVGAIHFGNSDSVNKKLVGFSNANTKSLAVEKQRICLRCQMRPSAFCGICRAYENSNGDFEKARKSFVKGESGNYQSPNVASDLVIEYAEIG